MNKFRISALCFACFAASTASATDLIDVYNQSLKSDPTFKESEATWLSAKTALPLARSYIFPHVDLTAHADRAYGRSSLHGINVSEGWNSQTGYGMSITQPVFNYAAWSGISEASASVKSATAMYLASSQDLMARVANAYFEVLRANQTLKYTLAEKNTLYQTLQQQLQEYRVGLIAITGVYNAQSQYDSIVALEIANRNTLSDRLEDLRAITGVYYPELAGLRNKVPLSTPEPSNINAWVNIAGQHNYGILAQKYAVVASREDIKVQAAASYPTIGLTSSYTDNNTRGGTAPGEHRVFNASAAVDFPIFQGGQTLANTDKARYDFLNSSATLEQTYRDTLNNTRQSYLNVSSLIYKISADLQSIKSQQNHLAATRAGYKVVTRTMVDVLMAIQELTEAQKDFANDQYDYILSTIALKADAGTLSVADLQKINQWLNSPLVFDTKIRSSLQPVNVNPNASATNFTASKVHHGNTAPYQTISPVVPQPPKGPPPAATNKTSKLPSQADSGKTFTTIDKTVSQQKSVTLPAPKLGKDMGVQTTTTTTSSVKTTTSKPKAAVDKTPVPVEVIDNKQSGTTKLPEPLKATANSTSTASTTTTTLEEPLKPAPSKPAISATTPAKLEQPLQPTTSKASTATATKLEQPLQATTRTDTAPAKLEQPLPATTASPTPDQPAPAPEKEVTDNSSQGRLSKDIPPAVSSQQTSKIQTSVSEPIQLRYAPKVEKAAQPAPASKAADNPKAAPGQFLTDPNASAKTAIKTTAHHYTIQLYASPQMSKVQTFMREHTLPNLTLASTTKQGKLWYEVQYGEYSDYQQAKQAKAKLPKTLSNGWIKRT